MLLQFIGLGEIWLCRRLSPLFPTRFVTTVPPLQASLYDFILFLTYHSVNLLLSYNFTHHIKQNWIWLAAIN